MKKQPCVKNQIAEIQAAVRLHDQIRMERLRDAQWHNDRMKARERADRRTRRLSKMVSTAQARVDGCENYPSPLAVRQLRRIVADTAMPGTLRVQAAELILKWAE